jgi:hypothetical protein
MTRVVNTAYEDYDVYIGRGSKWGNPFVIGVHGTRGLVMAKYRQHILSRPDLLAALPELKDKTLGCCCKPKPCHGDILVELVEERVK